MNLQANCCAKPKIINMDHRLWADEDGKLFIWKHGKFSHPIQMIDRICTRCGAHLYGQEGTAQMFTKDEWEARPKP